MRRQAVYVLYHGDEVVGVGTKRELAELFGIRPDTVSNYATDAYKRKTRHNPDRVVAVRVVEGDAG